MASRFEQDENPPPRECANCGAVEDLLRCGRCRSEWFCSLACHKAYWPFHRQTCRGNEFADSVEDSDPRFAAWLRRHGKQAVLGDAEVDRLERAGRAVCGPGREEVMTNMYGKLDPKPEEPKYTPEERRRMVEHAREEALKTRLMSRQDAAWSAITAEPGLGMECARYKWHQNQSHVYVHVRLPPGTPACRLRVELTPGSLTVALGPAAEGEQPLLAGQLYGAVKAEHSTWFVDDGLLQVRFLKCSRRGHYAAGATNAATWWRCLWDHCPPGETIPQPHPPTSYYWAEYEEDDLPPPVPSLPAPRVKKAGAVRKLRP